MIYPRVCGGTGRIQDVDPSAYGLSPRVRGNLSRDTAAYAAIGSIPACAGEPRWPTTAARLREVYPRVCGGTVDVDEAAAVSEGLSPRVRGNPVVELGQQRPLRSIPACAGEPTAEPFLTSGTWVYPRVCGGTIGKEACVSRDTGLSPRVRGNLAGSVPRGARPGSIPACAGEPCSVDGLCG